MQREIAKKRSNLRDVAEAAQVSVATVSRVLNMPGKVSVETRQRVEQAITELKFVPSAAARAINRGRSGMVAALLPTLDNAIYARVVNGLEARLAEDQLSLVVAQTGDDPATELARAKQMVDIGAEGLIVVGITHDEGLFALIDHAQIPVVAVSYYDAHSHLPTVGYDNWAAASAAAAHLSGLGHQHVTVLHGPKASNDRVQQRVNALQAAKTGIVFDFHEVPMTTQGGYQAIAKVLGCVPRPTALLCLSDVIAHGALSRLHSEGLRIPDEISVMGMEDLPGSRFTYPALTSVRLSVEEMGLRAAEAILSWLNDDVPPRSVELPFELVPRGSTGPCQTR